MISNLLQFRLEVKTGEVQEREWEICLQTLYSYLNFMWVVIYSNQSYLQMQMSPSGICNKVWYKVVRSLPWYPPLVFDKIPPVQIIKRRTLATIHFSKRAPANWSHRKLLEPFLCCLLGNLMIHHPLKFSNKKQTISS